MFSHNIRRFTQLFLIVIFLLSCTARADKRENKFLVNDEWVALPETASVLDFNADSSPAADDDLEGQYRLRDGRFWGRIYLDGWPQTIQYFRAHFGITPPLGKKTFVFAEPRDACTELTNDRYLTSDHIVLAWRGSCTYGTKAKTVDKTNASAIVILNNELGIDHLPGPDAHDIEISVASIGQLEGQLLETVYDESPKDPLTGFGRDLPGYMIPITCVKSGATCMATTVEESEYIKNMIEGGTLQLSKPDGSDPGLKEKDLPIEYLIAHFGIKVPLSSQSFPIALAKPVEACKTIENDVKGKLVLVRRGSCPFVQKAEEVQRAGGIAMIVGSTNPYILRMGVMPRWKGLNLVIPVATVSKRAYGILVAESYTGGLITFMEEKDSAFGGNKTINGETWEYFERLWNGEGWPRSDVYAEKKYHELKELYAGWPDKLATLEDAYARKKASDASGEGVQSEL